MSLSCPSCGNENTQSLSLVYNSGTRSSSSTAVGVATTGHGLGVGVAATSGMSQSQLAAKFGPPKKDQAIGSIWVLVVGIVLSIAIGATVNSETISWIIIAATFIVAFAIGRNAYRFNREELPRLYTEWERKLLCLRCGDVFQQPSQPLQTSQAPLALAAAPAPEQSCDADVPVPNAVFRVRLMSAGATPINTIKVIRDLTGCKLSEAKQIADSTPSVIQVCHSADEAETLRRRLSEKGLSVVVQPG